jgi:hypothetical protein
MDTFGFSVFIPQSEFRNPHLIKVYDGISLFARQNLEIPLGSPRLPAPVPTADGVAGFAKGRANQYN